MLSSHSALTLDGKQSGNKDAQVETRNLLGPLRSVKTKYILLGVKTRELTPISLLPPKIEEENTSETIRAFAQICLFASGRRGQSKDLSHTESTDPDGDGLFKP